jgi:hypothetical protein
MRISSQGTTSQRLGRLKEGSATTQPTIQNIPEDHDVFPKALIIISIEIYVKLASRDCPDWDYVVTDSFTFLVASPPMDIKGRMEAPPKGQVDN